MQTISDLIARNDANLAKWAIDRLAINIPAEWESLDDDERDWLVSTGIVAEVEAKVECTYAESWQSDWRTESNAAWPSYELTITADGMDEMTVDGWHLVGPMVPDGNRSSEEWATEDDDGCCHGLPRVDGWEVKPGDNESGGGLIQCWRDSTGRLVTLDREALGIDRSRCGALSGAASDADHGAEPDWTDVEVSDMETDGAVYIIRDGVIAEVEILTGGVAGHDVEEQDDDGDYHSHTEYHATAWATSLPGDETYQDETDARTAIGEAADDGEVYDSEREAIAALCENATDEHGVPDELTTDTDTDGWYVAIDGGDQDDRYHLSTHEAAALMAGGWGAIIDDLRDKFGTRALLSSLRSWQDEMDERIEAVDPFVGVEDSFRAGNCRPVTEQFAARVSSEIGADGTVGAVRASVILAMRDDPYTRRACRVAAMRHAR